jgi:pimeloyl-ACP methyl ester carboxylesterase
MEVIVLNPNHRRSRLLSTKYGIHYGMVNHTLHVFEDFLVTNNDPKRVFVIAHSMGGACISTTIEHFPNWATQKIVSIAYTDGFPEPMSDPKLQRWAFERSINWALNAQPVNTPMNDGSVAKTRSAGTRDHPLTTFKAFPFIWQWFDENAQAVYGAVPLVPTVVGFDTEEPAAKPNPDKLAAEKSPPPAEAPTGAKAQPEAPAAGEVQPEAPTVEVPAAEGSVPE